MAGYNAVHDLTLGGGDFGGCETAGVHNAALFRRCKPSKPVAHTAGTPMFIIRLGATKQDVPPPPPPFSSSPPPHVISSAAREFAGWDRAPPYEIRERRVDILSSPIFSDDARARAPALATGRWQSTIADDRGLVRADG